MTKKILITGGAGYIGSIGTEYLLQEGFKPVVIDDLSTGYRENLFDNVPFYEGKIGDKVLLEKIFNEHKIEVVLHFAGAALVEESMKNPQKYFDINFIQAIDMIETMLSKGINKIVFSSTCAVYGIPEEKDIPISEEIPTKPINVYGESKLAFEQALNWYKEKKNLNYIALRYFNVAGASTNRGERHEPETHLIPLTIKSVKDKSRKLKIFGNDYNTKDGTATRDYIHVIDLIYAHIKAIEMLVSNKKHKNVYNVGYGTGYTVLEIINAAKEVFNTDITFEIAERRAGDPPVLIADSRNTQNDLQWKPQHNNINEMISSASNFVH